MLVFIEHDIVTYFYLWFQFYELTLYEYLQCITQQSQCTNYFPYLLYVKVWASHSLQIRRLEF